MDFSGLKKLFTKMQAEGLHPAAQMVVRWQGEVVFDEVVGRSRLDLDEDDGVAVEHDKIDLASGRADVAGQGLEALLSAELFGDALALFAEVFSAGHVGGILS